MSRSQAQAWREREKAWRRFSLWTPPLSERERATRLRWLEDALRLARERGGLDDEPVDSQSLRARRQRVREALARIRV
ncbi:MAG: hypothetical protein ACYTDY_03965 [Planctomycetota bacterium]|jgi:hypothetical protein